jgi:hypothetical protein
MVFTWAHLVFFFLSQPSFSFIVSMSTHFALGFARTGWKPVIFMPGAGW